MMAALTSYPGLGLVPRDDRLLVHYYPEMVRDFISNPAYLRLPLEAKGVLQVLRHHLLHAAILPNDIEELAWLTREDPVGIERWLPALLASGIIVLTPDNRFLYCPSLEPLVKKAASDVKRLKKAGQSGGLASAESRRAKKDGEPPKAFADDVPM